MTPPVTKLLSPGTIDEHLLTYVVMGARYRDQWIFVRHRDRQTWEMPAGHIEPGETPNRAAVRELSEEAGVVNSSLTHLCDYSVTAGGNTGYGRLYLAEVDELDPQLEHEIEELKFTSELPLELTYPEVQTTLFARLFTLP